MGVRWKWLAGLFALSTLAAGWLAWQVVMPRPGLWLRDQGVWLGHVVPANGAVVQQSKPDHAIALSGRRGWLVESVTAILAV